MNTAAGGDLAGRIREALRIVIDPEFGHNIVDLGFVYDMAVEEGGLARITTTTTTRRYPATGFLKEGIANSAWSVPGCRVRRRQAQLRSALDVADDESGSQSRSRLHRRAQLT